MLPTGRPGGGPLLVPGVHLFNSCCSHMCSHSVLHRQIATTILAQGTRHAGLIKIRASSAFHRLSAAFAFHIRCCWCMGLAVSCPQRKVRNQQKLQSAGPSSAAFSTIIPGKLLAAFLQLRFDFLYCAAHGSDVFGFACSFRGNSKLGQKPTGPMHR